MSTSRVCAAVFFVAFAAPAAAQESAGRALFVIGEVERITPNGVARPLSKGEAVAQGDIVRTGPGAHLQLLMADQALIAVRPDSRLQIDAYQYRSQPGGDRAAWQLLKGGLRSITGAIGSETKSDYSLKSGSATIGIRGTDHETFLVASDGTQGAEPGTYNRVTVGGTYVENGQGRIDLEVGQSGFAGTGPQSLPMRLERTPAFMQTAFSRPTANSGPLMRESAPGDERRLQQPRGALFETGPAHAVRPVSPAQALGENVEKRGFGVGGRCGGPCAEQFLEGRDKPGKDKGIPPGQLKK